MPDLTDTVPPHAAEPLVQLMDHLNGPDSAVWLRALKRFLKHEDPWAAYRTVAQLTEEERTELIELSERIHAESSQSIRKLITRLESTRG